MSKKLIDYDGVELFIIGVFKFGELYSNLVFILL